ncbi:MAG TPA: iron-containing redox enzyme family protein [Candidatus Acidoferrales bacterium]|nr:iron-containing redox enzyme family protein [Candidatus Acidoferrales bacterium]
MDGQTEGVSSAEFVRQLKQEISRHSKQRVNHPFVRAVAAGRASMEEIRRWAIQDYQFRRAVPRIAMLRYLACSDPEIARRMFEVVEEETRGLLPGSAGHADLFVEFAESIGIARAELENAELRPATAAHLYYAELVIHTLPWFVVMAAQIGAEGTFPPAVAALGQGFMKQYGMRPEALRFFTVHAEADEEHGKLAEEIAVRYITSPHLQQQTREVTFRRMELLYDVWSIDY